MFARQLREEQVAHRELGRRGSDRQHETMRSSKPRPHGRIDRVASVMRSSLIVRVMVRCAWLVSAVVGSDPRFGAVARRLWSSTTRRRRLIRARLLSTTLNDAACQPGNSSA